MEDRLTTDWTEQTVALPGGGSAWSRGRHVRLARDLWWIEQEARFTGRQAGPYATGAGWMVECIELESGSMSFRCEGRIQPVPWSRFVWLLPAFSIVEIDFRDPHLRFAALAGRAGPAPVRMPSGQMRSTIFPLRAGLPASPEALSERLGTLETGLTVETTQFPGRVEPARRWIEAHYREPISVARLAKSLGVSHAHLSRQFRASVGMSPRRYQHYLRTSDALGRLAEGADITETSLDLGYSDLGRFYEQFRRLGCSSPGRYRHKRPGR